MQKSENTKREHVFNPKTAETDESSFSASAKHDYQPLPEDAAEAVRPIYTDLSNDKLLERCVGGFTQNNNESWNQLNWKITPKIVPRGSKMVEMSAYIDAGVCNEGTTSLLHHISAMWLSLCPNAHLYAQKQDAQRVTISDHRAQQSTRERRMIRRQHQIELLEAAEGTEGMLYGTAIDDSM